MQIYSQWVLMHQPMIIGVHHREAMYIPIPPITPRAMSRCHSAAALQLPHPIHRQLIVSMLTDRNMVIRNGLRFKTGVIPVAVSMVKVLRRPARPRRLQLQRAGRDVVHCMTSGILPMAIHLRSASVLRMGPMASRSTMQNRSRLTMMAMWPSPSRSSAVPIMWRIQFIPGPFPLNRTCVLNRDTALNRT